MKYVAASLLSIARLLVAGKERPQTEFEGEFWDMREKMKIVKDRLSKQSQAKLQADLISDLKSMGIPLASVDLRLGKFRGSFYVTTCKIIVNSTPIEGLEEHLRGKWSPKFRLKGTDGSQTTYNIR
jgi:hypothetical protein